MIRDVSSEGLRAQPVLERLDGLVDDAQQPLGDPTDGSEMATANFYLQKAVRAGDEEWEETVQGHHGPPVVGPLITDVEQVHELQGECTLQLVDLAQCWSGTPAVQSLQSDAVVLAAGVYFFFKLPLAFGEGDLTLSDLLDSFEELVGEAPEASHT